MLVQIPEGNRILRRRESQDLAIISYWTQEALEHNTLSSARDMSHIIVRNGSNLISRASCEEPKVEALIPVAAKCQHLPRDKVRSSRNTVLAGSQCRMEQVPRCMLQLLAVLMLPVRLCVDQAYPRMRLRVATHHALRGHCAGCQLPGHLRRRGVRLAVRALGAL